MLGTARRVVISTKAESDVPVMLRLEPNRSGAFLARGSLRLTRADLVLRSVQRLARVQRSVRNRCRKRFCKCETSYCPQWRTPSRDVQEASRCARPRGCSPRCSLWAMTAGCGDKEPLAPTPPALFAVRSVSPTAGVPGQTVTVTGSGFLPGAILTFAGIQAFDNVVTSAHISATLPRVPAGIVTVGVINADGQRATLTAAFTVQLPTTETQVVSFTVSPRVVAPGGELSISWAVSSPHSSADWIGLFGVDIPMTSFQEGYWHNVEAGLSGTALFRAPLQPGEDQFRYLLDDGYVDIARTPVTIR